MSVRKTLYPWAFSLPKNASIKMATLGPLGSMSAPGTWGSAAGILFYLILFDGMGFWRYIIWAILLAYIAIGVCDAAERHLGLRDPGMIILDEFVAIPFCFLPIFSNSYNSWAIFLGFIFFRFFDIRKPWIINKFQNLEGGIGCVADDLAAALATCITLNVCALLFPALIS